MEFRYFEPHAALTGLVGSYYLFRLPDGGADLVRAEIPNLRFFLAGSAVWDADGDAQHLAAPEALVFGPTSRARRFIAAPGAVLFGASVTPLGWRRFFGAPADECCDMVIDLGAFVPRVAAQAVERMASARGDADMVRAADTLFLDLGGGARDDNGAFIGAASSWLLNPELGGVDELLGKVDLSVRHTDRLCRRYFGEGPKRLHRKYRALHAANALVWTNETDWRSVAGDGFYDQSHFIREFSAFIGSTPGAFMRGQTPLIRQTLVQRLSIRHRSAFSLIG